MQRERNSQDTLQELLIYCGATELHDAGNVNSSAQL